MTNERKNKILANIEKREQAKSEHKRKKGGFGTTKSNGKFGKKRYNRINKLAHDEIYMDVLHNVGEPCFFCGKHPKKVEVHHLKKDAKGIAMSKASDYLTIIVCFLCHQKVHYYGLLEKTGTTHPQLHQESLRLFTKYKPLADAKRKKSEVNNEN